VSPQPKRKPTPAELKEARQKKIAIGGAVILVILLAVLGPRTFKQLHPSQQSTIPPSMRGLAPTARAATQAAPAAALSQLSDTDIVTVQPGSGQLVSFSLFKSKDPFVQQLASATPAATTPSAASAVPSQPAASKQTVTIPSLPTTTPAVTAPTPTVVTPVTPTPTPTSPAVTTPAPKPTAPAPTPVGSLNSAAISTNGHCEIVPVKGTFPRDDQVFRLVSIAANGASVKIAVAGGSYRSGASAVTLKRGTVLTLVNTADGVRYRLSLLTECPASSGGSSAKTTPTPAPTTTTTTTTTTATTTTSATTAPTTTVATPTSTTSTTP
jgi:hypothetical protein